jgi:uncharacterized cupin superfamily protein
MAEPDITFTTMKPANGERFQPLRRELGVSSFGMNLITLAPRQRSRIHAHEHQEEVYFVLEGELTLVVDGVDHPVPHGTLVRVGAAQRRQLVNRGRVATVLLALGGAGEHAGRDALAWNDWDETGAGQPPQEVPLPADLEV